MSDATAPAQPNLQAIKGSVGQFLVKALYEEITQLRTPWVVTPQQQQQQVLERLQEHVEKAVGIAVSRIAVAGFSHLVAQVDSLTIKDGAKAVLSLARGTEAMHEVADRVGSSALLVFADPQDFIAGIDAIKSQADQPDLPLGED